MNFKFFIQCPYFYGYFFIVIIIYFFIINGTGEQNILYSSFNSEPSKVIVNGIVKESCKKSCIFEYEINNVTIYFNDYITSCKNMFYNLSNIIEIDLSNFDFSRVITMKKKKKKNRKCVC